SRVARHPRRRALSGHSKWSSIKHKKGAADAKRGTLDSKLSRAIILAAKEGGGDPGGNLALQNAIEKARSYSMPKDNIERAIARGSGTESDGQSFETVVYEGYGPGGVAVIVEALTDNRTRTASEVRHAFDKNDGNLGTSGAVAWLFERRGVVVVPADGGGEDELTLAAAEGGADDVKLDGSTFEVVSAPEALTAVREALEAAGIPVDSAELTMVPKTTIEVADESSAKKIVRLMEELEDNDDVQDVYANFDIPERVLETVASEGHVPGTVPGTCLEKPCRSPRLLTAPPRCQRVGLAFAARTEGSRGSRVLPRRFSRPSRAGVRRDRARDASRVPADPRARPLHRCGVVPL